jgi:hypothetical protein
MPEASAKSDRTSMTPISIVMPDVAAAMSLSSVFAQAGADVRIGPAHEGLWRIWGHSPLAASTLRTLVSEWVDREQIFCAELDLQPAREVVAA